MTKRTRAVFLSNAATLINDNTTGQISPADVRSMFMDIADSAVFLEDEYEREIVSHAGAAYTLVLADAWRQIQTDNVVNIPDNATVAFEVGTVIWVQDDGSGTATIAAPGVATVDTSVDLELSANQLVALIKTGTDSWLMTDDASPSIPQDLKFSYIGTPVADEVFHQELTARSVIFPADFAGSYGRVSTVPTAEYAVDVRDDGTSIGTITIGTDGSFTFSTTGATEQVVAAGSLISLVGQNTPDGTLSDIFAVLAGEIS